MTDFGKFPGRDCRVYTVTIEPHAVPVSLLFPVTGDGQREFVFVPDPKMAKEFAGPFKGLSHSKALGSIYRYVDRGRREIPLEGEDSSAVNRPRQARFALVQWDKTAKVEFPHEVHCIQRVPYGQSGRAMHEIVPATDITGRAAGGAR